MESGLIPRPDSFHLLHAGRERYVVEHGGWAEHRLVGQHNALERTMGLCARSSVPQPNVAIVEDSHCARLARGGRQQSGRGWNEGIFAKGSTPGSPYRADVSREATDTEHPGLLVVDAVLQKLNFDSGARRRHHEQRLVDGIPSNDVVCPVGGNVLHGVHPHILRRGASVRIDVRRARRSNAELERDRRHTEVDAVNAHRAGTRRHNVHEAAACGK